MLGHTPSVPPAVVAAVAGVFGLLIGSFLNVVIYRIPANRSIVRPPSACPGCGTAIRARDNIPVVSWLVLRGRCRTCREPISARYPAVELFTGVVLACLGLRYGWTWTTLGEAVFAAGMIALALIDLDHLRLPKKVVYADLVLTAAVLVVAAALGGQWHRLGVAALCAVVPWAIFFAINFVSPRALGFGDVRLALLIGLALGWLGVGVTIVGFVLASLLGSIVGVTLIALRRMARRTPVPFGTFLAAGSILALFLAAPIASWYQSLIV